MADRHSTGLSWRANDEGSYCIDGVLGTVAIAFGESRTSNGGRTGVVDDEGEWNARLFAAAPALVEAVDAALELIGDRPDRAGAVVRSVLRAARMRAVGR